MTSKKRTILVAGEVVENSPALSLAEICDLCGLHAEQIIEYVEFGVIEPENARAARWRFSGASIVRINKAQRLRHDLSIDTAGVALALDLLDRIDHLRTRLHNLERRERR